MSTLRELYQQMIIDHGRNPRNFGTQINANHIQEGFNPLCGDKIILYLNENNGAIENVSFTGKGCAISMASASLMTESIKGKTINELKELFNDFHQLVTQNANETLTNKLGKLTVLAGVSEFPARVKCATLAWHTLMAAINNEKNTVSTE